MEHTINIDDHIWEMAMIEAEKREITTNEIVKKRWRHILVLIIRSYH